MESSRDKAMGGRMEAASVAGNISSAKKAHEKNAVKPSKQSSADERIRVLDERINKKLHQNSVERGNSKQPSSVIDTLEQKEERVERQTKNKIVEGANSSKPSTFRKSKVSIFDRRSKKMSPTDTASVPKRAATTVPVEDKISFLDARLRRKMQQNSSEQARNSDNVKTSRQNTRFEELIERKLASNQAVDTIDEERKVNTKRVLEQIGDSGRGPQLPPGIAPEVATDQGYWTKSIDTQTQAKPRRVLEQIGDSGRGPHLPPGMAPEVVSDHGERYWQKMCNEASATAGALGEEEKSSDTQTPVNMDMAIDLQTQPKLYPSSLSSSEAHRNATAATQYKLDGTPFFPVEAILVKEASSSESYHRPSEPVYDAVLIPDQVLLPWWRRTKTTRAGMVIIVAAAIATTVGALVSSSTDKDTIQTGESLGPAPTPTFYPPPFNCTVSDLEHLYEIDKDYDYKLHLVDAVGDTTVSVRTPDSYSAHIKFAEGNDSSTSIETYYWVGAIALSESAAVAGAGGTPEDDWIGSIHMFERDLSGKWNTTATHIVPSNIGKGADFGRALDIDSGLMIVSAPNDRDTIGSVFIYRRGHTAWVEEAKITPFGQNYQNFGGSVAVKGSTVVIGDNIYGADGEGAVFVYKHDSSAWVLNYTITSDDCDRNFGNSVVLADDDSLLIGCPGNDDKIGAVYCYRQSETGKYLLYQIIKASDGGVLDEFGEELVVDGNFLAVGTFKQTNAQVYLFTLHESVWKEVVKIKAPSVNVSYFGSDIALSGRKIFVSYWGNVLSYKLFCSD